MVEVFRVRSFGCTVSGVVSSVKGLEFRNWGLGSRVEGLWYGFRVQGAGFS